MMKEVKGITFNYISNQDAEHYLDYINNYFRTACYRKSFEKYTSGENKGKYIGLDFLHFQEFSTIDMHLRHLISNTVSRYRTCIVSRHDIPMIFYQAGS